MRQSIDKSLITGVPMASSPPVKGSLKLEIPGNFVSNTEVDSDPSLSKRFDLSSCQKMDKYHSSIHFVHKPEGIEVLHIDR